MKIIGIVTIYTLIIVFTGCSNPPKTDKKEVLKGEWHRVLPSLEIFLPEEFAYFNLESNRQRVKQMIKDSFDFARLEKLSNTYFGAKLFLDTVKLNNSVVFFTSREYLAINQKNMGLLITMIESRQDFMSELEKEEATITKMGDKDIFKLKYRTSSNKYMVYYLVSFKRQTVGFIIGNDEGDLQQYIKKIKFY